jgi:hypothetical protein
MLLSVYGKIRIRIRLSGSYWLLKKYFPWLGINLKLLRLFITKQRSSRFEESASGSLSSREKIDVACAEKQS